MHRIAYNCTSTTTHCHYRHLFLKKLNLCEGIELHINVRLQLHTVIIVIYFERILQFFHKNTEGPNRGNWSS